MSALVKKHPAISMLVLIIILGIAPSLGVAAGWLPPQVQLFGALCSPLAAIVLVLVEGRKGGLRELFSRFLIWRVGLRWWAIALFFAIIPSVASLYVFDLLGGPPVDWSGLAPIHTVLPTILMYTIFAVLSEEIGWRGYLLPRLQARYNALVSSLIVGVVWAAWHIPMFFIEGNSQYVWGNQGGRLTAILAYSVFMIFFSIQFTWVFNNTRGSLLLAAVMHGAANAWAEYIDIYRGSFGQILTFMAASALVSIIILLVAGARDLSRTNQRNVIRLEDGQAGRAPSAEGGVVQPSSPQ